MERLTSYIHQKNAVGATMITKATILLYSGIISVMLSHSLELPIVVMVLMLISFIVSIVAMVKSNEKCFYVTHVLDFALQIVSFALLVIEKEKGILSKKYLNSRIYMSVMNFIVFGLATVVMIVNACYQKRRPEQREQPQDVENIELTF